MISVDSSSLMYRLVLTKCTRGGARQRTLFVGLIDEECPRMTAASGERQTEEYEGGKEVSIRKSDPKF